MKRMEFSYDQNGELTKITYIQSVFGPNFPKGVIEYKNGRNGQAIIGRFKWKRN